MMDQSIVEYARLRIDSIIIARRQYARRGVLESLLKKSHMQMFEGLI